MQNNEQSVSLTKKIAITAILLAICIISQFFKNLSVYITGPIINLCLVLAALTAGLLWGTILAVVTPVTAFFIAASPVMMAVPTIIPFIMLGNEVLVLGTYFFLRPALKNNQGAINFSSILAAILTAAAKGLVMGLTIALWLLPTFIPEASPLREKMPIFQSTFSIVQFTTAIIGFVYFFILWTPLKKILPEIV